MRENKNHRETKPPCSSVNHTSVCYPELSPCHEEIVTYLASKLISKKGSFQFLNGDYVLLSLLYEIRLIPHGGLNECLTSVNSDHIKCSFSCVFCSISLYLKENSHLTDSATREACCVKETPMQVIVFFFITVRLLD